MRWLKIGVDTPNKQAIRNASRECRCSKGDAFLAFFRLYAWLDEQTADGKLYADKDELDAIAQLVGFSASLERSGWLSFQGDICTVTNWGEHNGNCAKRRAIDAKRKNEIREEKRKANVPVRSLPRKSLI